MTSEDILDDINEQPVLQNALADFENLEVTNEVSAGMFADDMFYAFVIELEELICDLDHMRIREIWKVSSIDMKSQHFVVLYDEATHLCTCLTLINRGIVCRHFLIIMLMSNIASSMLD
ncbi:4433_t:CDS:2 [Gigaspora rosea]|nr:4433_t:CDS:2 [Gigaspora rosea]